MDSLFTLTINLDFAGAWSGLLLFDTVIFSLTFYRVMSMRRSGTRQLFTILLRDGKCDKQLLVL